MCRALRERRKTGKQVFSNVCDKYRTPCQHYFTFISFRGHDGSQDPVYHPGQDRWNDHSLVLAIAMVMLVIIVILVVIIVIMVISSLS